MNANPAPRKTPNPSSNFQWEIDEATGGAIKSLADKKVKTLVVSIQIGDENDAQNAEPPATPSL